MATGVTPLNASSSATELLQDPATRNHPPAVTLDSDKSPFGQHRRFSSDRSSLPQHRRFSSDHKSPSLYYRVTPFKSPALQHRRISSNSSPSSALRRVSSQNSPISPLTCSSSRNPSRTSSEILEMRRKESEETALQSSLLPLDRHHQLLCLISTLQESCQNAEQQVRMQAQIIDDVYAAVQKGGFASYSDSYKQVYKAYGIAVSPNLTQTIETIRQCVNRQGFKKLKDAILKLTDEDEPEDPLIDQYKGKLSDIFIQEVWPLMSALWPILKSVSEIRKVWNQMYKTAAAFHEVLDKRFQEGNFAKIPANKNRTFCHPTSKMQFSSQDFPHFHSALPLDELDEPKPHDDIFLPIPENFETLLPATFLYLLSKVSSVQRDLFEVRISPTSKLHLSGMASS